MSRWVVTVLGITISLAAGCRSDESTPERPEATPATTLVPGLELSSAEVEPDGEIPERFTCAAEDVSPPLTIDGVPGDTESLALTLTDPDAGDLVHWVVTGIDPGTASMGEGEVPAGAVQYPTDLGRAGYGGPCPPPGESHEYVFMLYAVPAGAEPLPAPAEANGRVVIAELEALDAPTATLTAAYTSPG